MKRLEIASKKKAVLPMSYNGKDFDVEINLADIAVTSLMLNMADDCMKLQEHVREVAKLNDLEAMRNVANEALNKADEFYTAFCELCPNFKEGTQGNPVRDFAVWGEILSAVAELISEEKTQQKIEKEVQEESSETLEG